MFSLDSVTVSYTRSSFNRCTVTDAVWGDSYALSRLTLDTLPTAYSLRTRVEERPERTQNTDDSGYTTVMKEVETARPAVEVYMDYILVDSGTAVDVYSRDGKLLVASLDTEKYATGRYIIYGYNTCEAFYNGVHMDDGNSCVVNCDQCGIYGIMEENPQHNFETAIAYENGYASVGVITRACSNDGCVCNATPETQDAASILSSSILSRTPANFIESRKPSRFSFETKSLTV